MAFNPYAMPTQNYGPYNPLAPYQQRLDQMQQQWGGMQQFAGQPQQPSVLGVKGRPVSSEDEARSTVIDMDGSTFFFPNLGANCIYTKQMNPETFAPIFRVYRLEEQSQAKSVAPIDTSAFVPRTDFDELAALVAALQEQVQQTSTKRTSKEDAK